MKRIAGFLVVFLLISVSAKGQDTTIVQTLTYDSTARSGTWTFPDDSTKTYRKVLMQYSMRCHDLQVGNGNVGCREWDYSCNTVIVDSSQVDSVAKTNDSHVISNFSGPTYNISNGNTYTYYDYIQHNVQYSATLAETVATVGSATTPNSQPFGTLQPISRTQYLWTASELSNAGLPSGDITGIWMNLLAPGTPVDFLRIRLKTTTKTLLDNKSPDTDGFTEVYFLNTAMVTPGTQKFNFYNNFNWNGSDNIIVDISYRNTAGGTDNVVAGTNSGNDFGLYTQDADAYLEFTGAEYVDIPTNGFNSITNEITISFWAWGDASLPQNTTIFEGTDNNNDRQVNVHLPWSNAQVYWDCGNDGTGYDRINLIANQADYSGKWSHWAFTKNTVTGVMNIYLNGNLFHTGSGNTRPIDLQNFRIGRSITGGTQYYGSINNFRVWSAELSQTSIQDWMYRDVDNTHPNWADLEAQYLFNEGTGQTVADASANAGSATISGAPTWRQVAPRNLSHNFTVTQTRPNTTFVKGSYTSTTVNTTIRDSVLNAQNQVIAYTVNGTDLVTVDTNYYFQAGTQYVYDENNMIVDSVAVPADSTINVTVLDYFTKGPMQIELLSLVTPYGNGLNLGPNGVMWEFDMTDYVNVLRGSKYMYMHRGGQNQEEIDIKFLFIEGTPPRDVHALQNIWPLTGQLGQAGNSYTNIVNDAIFEPRQVWLDTAHAEWKIRSSITGHGQNGEFIARWHYVDLNGGTPEWRWQVWKECADLPTYPQGGTWLYDRAGWCPGVPTDVEEYPLDAYVTPGQTVTIDYGIDPVSNMSTSNYLVAQQLVSYGPKNFSLDAAVETVKRPTNRTERYKRYNPACTEPVILLKNEGSTPLTSVTITYNVRGGTSATYTWTGNLNFDEIEEVALPVDNLVFWNGTDNVFEVQLSAPNGGTDGNPDNDIYSTTFTPHDYYSGNSVAFYWRTNNQPSQNQWRVYDETGAIVLQSSPFLSANTTYNEVMTLPAGCYTFRITDSGDDGLYYWATPGNGTGFARWRENGTNVKIFEPEFGKFIQYDFWMDGYVSNEEQLTARQMTLFPNPSNGEFTLQLTGYMDQDVDIAVYDLMGKQVFQSHFQTGSADYIRESIDLTTFANGNYILKVIAGGTVESMSMVKQ